MKKILPFLLLTFFIFSFSEAQGQDITRFIHKRRLKAEDAAVERTGKETDKAVTKEVNKAMDKIFGKEKEEEAKTNDTVNNTISNEVEESSGSSIGMNAMMGAMGISSGSANVKPLYEYEGFIEMTITSYENGEKEDESTIYKTFIDSKSLDYGVVVNEAGKEDLVFIIFDTENSLMITLSDSDNEKTGFAIGFTPEQAEAITEDLEEEEEIADPYETFKTGKTKKILGYKCDEYIIEDDYSITSMWITNELNNKMKKTYQSNSTFAGVFAHGSNTQGVVMENITEDKSDHDKTVMTVTDIDLDKKHSISTVGYNIMSMGNVMMEEE